MPDFSKRRELLKLTREAINFLNEEEIYEIGIIILKALERIEKESGGLKDE